MRSYLVILYIIIIIILLIVCINTSSKIIVAIIGSIIVILGIFIYNPIPKLTCRHRKKNGGPNNSQEIAKYHRKLMKGCYMKIYKSNIQYHKLMNSVYPYQINDYYLLKLPNSKKYVPCDAPLKNIIPFLWKNKIHTEGWDAFDDVFGGFITFKHKTSDKKDSWTILKNLINPRHIMFHDHINFPIPSMGDWTINILKKHPNKIHVNDDHYGYALTFTEKTLKLLHKQLKLPYPDTSDALLGFNSCAKIS